ncbi:MULTISPECIES: peptidase E [Thermomonospora]|uniref:Peptidase S51 dipeptidase E n=1 Tax=Thermomonospora curvata (strain ATCC 19995 / DSM 43183 / JCM 3096 / KCTC 9072 / NBRC 15933 / NCIMB 10081 / Henssen B9) TaxID=471852 RepID=D1A8Z9_THECD|nr:MULTISPECIES: peptidase E [Thermomonospora]ACY98637.1 peptidase S51 dipeptidase E [Thermomonospora curvata DSM 43183]PKK13765.1 MAG: peptidase E [Thermomonospora sp. CIF 1]
MSTDGQPHILAIGGGTFIPDDRYGLSPSPLLRYALDLTGQDRPRVCFLATAQGDGSEHIARGYAALSRLDAEVSHLALFPMPNVADVRSHILSQDLLYVFGGSVANLLALWRLHGLVEILREAWQEGVVLAGQSAGALCWHVGGNTDSFGPRLRPLTDGLGFVPYSCGVHYDSDPQRRPLLHRSVGEGLLPAGYAADEGVGLHYVGTELVQAVSYREQGRAYGIEPDGSGGVKEMVIEPRLLSGS